MDYYEAWFDLKNSARDLEFSERVRDFLGHLREKGMIEGYRLTRRKLGFGPRELGEWHIVIETKNLAQLDEAFLHAASRGPDIEPLHAGVYSMIESVRFGLYRDFPDPVRQETNKGRGT